MLLLKHIWAVTWRILVFFMAWTLLTAPLIIPIVKKYAPRGSATPLGLRLYIEIVSVLSILIVAWLMLHFLDRRPFVSLGFARRGPVLGETVSGNRSGLAGASSILPTAADDGGKFGVEGGLIAIVITILGTPLVLLAFRTRSRSATTTP